jgi:hypothetical protein
MRLAALTLLLAAPALVAAPVEKKPAKEPEPREIKLKGVKLPVRTEPLDKCQGTRTFTRLGDTNRYEPDPQPRNARGHFSYFPVFPPHGSRPPLRAAASRPRHALPGLALSGPPRYAPHAG